MNYDLSPMMKSIAAAPSMPQNGHRASDDGCGNLRDFYLLPQETYSLAELARLWRVALDDVRVIFSDAPSAAVCHDADIGTFRVTWADAVKAAMVNYVFRAIEVEQALGGDFNRVRSDRWRTIPVVLHVPNFIADALERIPMVPALDSLAARAERLLCETVEAECILQLRARNYSHETGRDIANCSRRPFKSGEFQIMIQSSASQRFTLAFPVVLLLFIVHSGHGEPAGHLPFTLAAATDTTLSVVVTGAQITARGVAPNGEVVLFGRTHRHVGGTPHLGHHASVERDGDGDGVVTVTLEGLPPHSVWIAVDQQTGSHAVAASEGQELRVMGLPSAAWREGTESIDVSSGYLDFLLVRPGKGAWRLDITQGGRNDDDGTIDAVLRARLGVLEHLTGKEKAPAHAQKKDVLAIIDPRTLDVFVKAAE